MKSDKPNRSVKIPINERDVFIGGELGVPCTTNRLHGGLNALERRERLYGSYTRTLMFAPHDPGVMNRIRKETGIE